MMQSFEAVQTFVDTGGWVLYLIMANIFLLFVLLLERAMYLKLQHRTHLTRIVNYWCARSERVSWHAHHIRHNKLALMSSALDARTRLIKALVALCPLFGLLGTVTGMIEVFEVMSLLGGGNPKAMASGISKATMPTMAGMVGAIVGILGLTFLERAIKNEKSFAERQLSFDTA